MQIGIFTGDAVGRGGLDQIRSEARQAAEAGLDSFAIPNIFGLDALTTLVAIAPDAPGLEMGVAVVPTYSRHPVAMAQQAATTNVLIGGRLMLGVGLSHQIVIENMFGLSYDKPVRHAREYLNVLTSLVRTGNASFKGETMTVSAALDIEGESPFPILLAALGPQMLKLAGTLADGTVTWMTGPNTLRDHVVPRITEAAEGAGRDVAPRISAGVPLAVTDDAETARNEAGTTLATYGMLPSYRAMLDREGAAGPADVAVVGTEDEVLTQLGHYRDAGVTDLSAVLFSKDPDTRARSVAVLADLVEES